MIFASNIINTVENNNQNISKYISDGYDDFVNDASYYENKPLKPTAIEYNINNDVRVADSLSSTGKQSSDASNNKTSLGTIISLDLFEDTPITKDTIKYIKHTQSITIVPDGSYVWEHSGLQGQWRLSILDKNLRQIATNGFYRVDGKTYYFDSDGYMFIGTIMDERDTVYYFGDDGSMQYKIP